MRLISILFFLSFSIQISAQKIHGVVYTDKGDLLPFASITVKGTSVGTSANTNAKFSFSLPPGKYILVCQHIGFAALEKTIEVKEDLEVTFILSEQKLTMKEVVVKSGAEDPAYAIIRQAIKKRPFYNEQVNAFTCNLYGKDLIKLRSLPNKVLGKKIDADDKKEMGVDSTGKGIVYLSESVSKVSVQRPDKFKLEVISSRVSGSGSFGFTFPSFITLYTNNVNVFSETFNPRGFISPIADGALNFYKYKFLGTFFEDGKAINAIRVIPRRNYEPLFSGVINITDDDWRIHSFDLVLTKTSQLELMDTLQITQLHVPVSNDTWRVKNQLLHFNFSQFGVDAVGNFLSVYSDYNLQPSFSKKFFDNIVVKYDTAVSNKSKAYWDTIRPVPLEFEESKDYRVKDSTFKAMQDSMFTKRNIDTLKKRQGNLKPLRIFWNGIDRMHYSKTNTFHWGIEALIKNLEYNPAEGLVLNVLGYYNKILKGARSEIYVFPTLRYGFSNTHFNGWLEVELRKRDMSAFRKSKRETWAFAGGKTVKQFNKERPITALENSITTLFYGNNFMKTYENYFGSISFRKRFESGLRIAVSALYEDRMPLDNTTDFTIFKKDRHKIKPNDPYVNGFDSIHMQRNQAVIVSFDVSFKPGQKYVQLPYSKIPLGSKYPTLSFNYTKGISDILGSDVNYDKWRFTIFDDKNLKLAGTFKYKTGIGGFINAHKAFVPDFQHFRGNELTSALNEYVNSFQRARYYAYSNTAGFHAFANIEHHFNGLITNKIPLLKRWNWNLVAGGNAFYIDNHESYGEVFVGIENILKLLRVDVVTSFERNRPPVTGVKIGTGGLLGNNVKLNNSPRRGGNDLSFGF